ncbi:hypothetical protein B0H16DRAFT_1580204 [Mycena metata]|uniref:Uncharacterized protein n=1 Tax=Mycena metata TaxID=1033252 RepID=A0AAD7MUV4_9AGAR|nr:hypothetical protein B0H16DRAFT_1580204 [Mycena metata]
MTSAFLTSVAAPSNALIAGVHVPADVLGHILCSCPDFATLGAAVGVCSMWQRVFEAHFSSTVLAVAWNMLGPALPQAVRFVRYPYAEKTPNDWGDGEEDVTDDDSDTEGAGTSKKKIKTPPTLPETDAIGELTVAERIQLRKNAATVEKLEALFSIRHKTRTSKTSTLTAAESHRFTRAMYRIMLYCALFYLPLDLDDIDSMEDEPGVLDKIKHARKAMLAEYPLAHQAEVFAVVAFLHELIAEVLYGDSDGAGRTFILAPSLKDVCLATGPAVILRAHTNARLVAVFEEALEPEMLNSDGNPLYGGFVSEPLESIWAAQQGGPPETGLGVILDSMQSVSVAPDKCAQCNLKGVKLWNEANWPSLIPVDFWALLPGKLNKNPIEGKALVQLLMAQPADIVVSQIYDEVLLPEFAAWGKDESLCGGCLEKLVGAHLCAWAWKRRVEAGWKPPPKCWYGYSCNTQMHRRTHAKDKTHLCAPTR